QPGGRRPAGGVYKDRITPHWFQDNTRFWYRNDLPRGAREFIVVDAEPGRRGPAFDHQKLAAALSKAAGQDYRAERLPFDAIEFAGGGEAVRFRAGDPRWQCDLTAYECLRVEGGPAPAGEEVAAPTDDSKAATLTANALESPWAGGCGAASGDS